MFCLYVYMCTMSEDALLSGKAMFITWLCSAAGPL